MAAGQSFRSLLEVLSRHRVDFVVVGATAAVLEGAPMTTFDLDVLFDNCADNRARLLGALEEIEAVDVDPMDRGIRPTDARLASHRISLLHTSLGRLEVSSVIAPGWSFADVTSRSHRLEVGELEVRVLDLESLIESKEATGREKDLAALPLLREPQRVRGSRESD